MAVQVDWQINPHPRPPSKANITYHTTRPVYSLQEEIADTALDNTIEFEPIVINEEDRGYN